MSLDWCKDVPVVSSGTAAESAAVCSKASPTARPKALQPFWAIAFVSRAWKPGWKGSNLIQLM